MASIFAAAACGGRAAELEGEPGLEPLGGEIKAVEEGGEGEDGIDGDDEETRGFGQGEEDDEVEEMRPVYKDIRVVPHDDEGRPKWEEPASCVCCCEGGKDDEGWLSVCCKGQSCRIVYLWL